MATAQTGRDWFPNVPLVTHTGRTVRFYDDVLRNRFVVVSFMYADCASLCPLVTANLARVRDLLADRAGRDLFFWSITLRPEQDTPAALARYAAGHGLGRGFTLLTGQRADIERVRRSLGAVDRDPAIDADAARHTGMVRYGHEGPGRWGASPGEASPKWLARAIASIMPPARS
jgi:protein SCO1/2